MTIMLSDSLKGLRRDLHIKLNDKLSEVFSLIDYKTPFTMKVSVHATERIGERVCGKLRARQVGKLFNRIITNGLCELLYYQTRYANGDKIEPVEFTLDDLVVPVSFVADFVVLRTVMIWDPGTDRSGYTQIDLSDQKFEDVMNKVGVDFW